MRRPCGWNRNSYRYCTWNSVHSRAEARLPTVYCLALVMQRVMLRKQLCRSWPRTWPKFLESRTSEAMRHVLTTTDETRAARFAEGAAGWQNKRERQRVTGKKPGSCFGRSGPRVFGEAKQSGMPIKHR